MTINGEFDKIAELSKLDVLSIFYGALIHDFKHPGLNNGFQINTKTDISVLFNGKTNIFIIFILLFKNQILR